MKKQIIIATIMVLMLIGFVSARVSITPNELTIDAYPGETHQANFSISTDKTDVVFLDSPNTFITISPSELIVHDGEEISLDIIFSKNTPLGVLSFIINVSAEEIIVEVPVPGDCPSCGRGTRTVYVDRNNTEYIVLGEDSEENIWDFDYVTDDDLTEYINQTDDIILEEEKPGFWRRIWNWLKGIFRRG